MSVLRSVTCLAVLMLGWLSVIAPPSASASTQHAGPPSTAPSELLTTVRQATEQFRDVRNAAPDYGPILGCVSGPEFGAMGVHFVNPALLSDDVLDPRRPEALIYEFKNGVARLVGVEFIVIADVWHQKHSLQDPPVLDAQQLLHFVDSPNRFGLPAFYEIHVWAWQDNPNGVFVDWNPRVSCEG